MSNMLVNISWHIWYVFVLVKTDSDYYTNGKYSYKKKFQSVLGNSLRFTKSHTKKV